MINDQENVHFLLDENLDDDQNQDQIIERYLNEDQIEYSIFKQIQKTYQIHCNEKRREKVVQIQDQRIVKRPQLKGMMKLQASGRLMEKIQFPLEKCICENTLIINCDWQFSFILKDFNFQIVNEYEALKIINIKLQENPCIQKKCEGFNKIYINCSNTKFNYDELQRKCFYQTSNFTLQSFHIFLGENYKQI